jgi:hypothetical protein
MTTYRLGSSSAVHAPGLIAWAINGYAFERDRLQMLNVIGATFPTLPHTALVQLLSKKVRYEVEAETVVFEVEDTPC